MTSASALRRRQRRLQRAPDGVHTCDSGGSRAGPLDSYGSGRYPTPVTRTLPAALRSALAEYADRLRAVFGDRLVDVRLFGSFARGEAHEDSDVDVLVVVDGLTDLEIGLAAGEVAPVIVKTGLPLAPLPMASERLAELRRQKRALALALDSEGISL
jgi:uncharacterized protein